MLLGLLARCGSTSSDCRLRFLAILVEAGFLICALDPSTTDDEALADDEPGFGGLGAVSGGTRDEEEAVGSAVGVL